jgi:hypothetical protein
LRSPIAFIAKQFGHLRGAAQCFDDFFVGWHGNVAIEELADIKHHVYF